MPTSTSDILSVLQRKNPKFYDAVHSSDFLQRVLHDRRTAQAALEYIALLFLLWLNPQLTVAPTVAADAILHLHLEDSSFAQDTANLFSGATIVHRPGQDNPPAFATACALLEKQFQLAVGDGAARCEIFLKPSDRT